MKCPVKSSAEWVKGGAIADSGESPARRIAATSMSGMQILIVGLCVMLNMVDGMDVVALSCVAPMLSAEWGMPANRMGWLFSAGLPGMPSLLIARVFTGLGVGGMLPALAAIATEFSNESRRDFSVGLVQAGWPFGAILTGIFAAWASMHVGWRGLMAAVAAVWMRACKDFCVKSHTLPAGARTMCGQERYDRDFC